MKLFPYLGVTIVVSSVTGAIAPAFAQPQAQLKAANLPNMTTPITADNLDAAAFAEWFNGAEKPIQPLSPTDKGRIPQSLVWNDKNPVGWGIFKFGDSKTSGVRHLRIGFKAPVAVGSVLVRGGGTLSVLKADATYPADLNDQTQWVPAQRLINGELSTEEVKGDQYALWTLPAGTSTLALRFTHTSTPTDANYAGELGSVFIMNDRLSDLAPQATVATSSNTQKANLITNSIDEGWKTWDNDTNANSPALSQEKAEWVKIVWPTPIRLSGLMALWAGFGAAEAQIYVGPANRHPRDASDSDWQTIQSFSEIKNGYPTPLWPNRLDFGKTVTTRAVRLRITAAAKKSHPHVDNKIQDGKRIWLGELMALQPLDKAPLQTVKFELDEVAAPNPPIPVRFNLKQAGYVTLVIEDSKGKRVRNLVSQTYFPAGPNTAWWDGTDDLGRDTDAANHGLYRIPAQLVAPDKYRVRGLVHDAIKPHYEFSVYTPGTPPWKTQDTTGAWLTNHTPPQAALFVPAKDAPNGKPMVYLGSYVAEGGSGLAWVDLEGRKQGGRVWVGGTWTAAPFLVRDAGANAIAGEYAYVGAVWGFDKDKEKKNTAELRLTALTDKGDRAVLRYEFERSTIGGDIQESGGLADNVVTREIGGIAINNGVLVVSLPLKNQLLFVDAKAGKVIGTAPLQNVRGVAFDGQGRLFVLTQTTLVRYEKAQSPEQLGRAQTVITGLEDAKQLTFDSKGNLYISDGGQSHQVKVFSPMGQFLRAIGKAGVPKAGPYDPLHMNNPAGLAIDSNDQLWVTEKDYLPKRVSVWSLDGKLIKAFYGPGKYGGGGVLDSQDKTKFYYADDNRGTMEFKLDWQKGEANLSQVLYRRQSEDLQLATRASAPETAIYLNGRRYFVNCFNSSPTGGSPTAFIFLEKNGLLSPVAAFGRANEWDILRTEPFASHLLAGFDWKKNAALFAWSDTNGDAKVQPDEVVFQKSPDNNIGGVTIMPDLSFCITRFGGKAMQFKPGGFSATGVPRYDLATGQTLGEGVLPPSSSGGDQILATGTDGWSAVTLGVKPFSSLSLSGVQNGEAKWSYPSLWPGLHASHRAPKPNAAGQLIGTTRLLGGVINPKGSDVGPLWAVNSNMGPVCLFTADGLFVSTVFEDSRVGKSWYMPVAERNMSLEGVALQDENFWPSITQTPDGQVYMVDGARLAIVRLDGLDTLRRLPDIELPVTVADLQKAQTYLVEAESARQQNKGSGVLEAALTNAAPVVDGKLDEWTNAKWVDIDKSGVGAHFNSSSKPYDMTGALRIAGDRLYVAYRTSDVNLLQNSGEVPTAPFKTGGALDLMLGTNPNADSKRANPVEGDIRLLVTQIKGKPMALVYRAVVAGTKTPVPFSSPWRTITLDRVDDVSNQIQFAGADGNYEYSIPLATLGLKPQSGQSIQGDIGILRGDGTQTVARSYWSNKATGITADVPAEAMLTPQLWGRIEFKAAP